MPSRSRKKPLFEEIAEPFANLPVKAGVVAGAVLATIGWALPVLVPSEGLNVAGSFAMIARYLLWLLAFMIALSSVVGALRRGFDRRRFDSDIHVEDLTWEQFEGYLAEYFRRRGSTVAYRGGSQADGGVDLVVDDSSGRRILQAKHWRTRSVGVVPLRALWGVLGDEQAQGAICVTSGTFTPDALAFAKDKRLELIDGAQLHRLIAEVKSSGEPVSATTATTAVEAAEACPQCGRGVVERKRARRGRNAGSYFFGCDRYPQCRYARDA